MNSGPGSLELQRARNQLDQFAWLMDQCFRIPILNWRFGLEALIGLVPGAGDVVSGALGLVLLIRAFQFKLPRIVITRMILNSLLDIGAGTVPILGDVFDFAWKSNTRNMKLFHRYASEPQAGTRRHWIFLGLLIAGFLAVFAVVMSVVLYFLFVILRRM
jgi:hypothetical protein